MNFKKNLKGKGRKLSSLNAQEIFSLLCFNDINFGDLKKNYLGQVLLALRPASRVIHCELLNDCSCAYCKWGPCFLPADCIFPQESHAFKRRIAFSPSRLKDPK